MKQRGRESAARLATVTALPLVARIQPPKGLCKDEKALFVRVVDSKPADWFTAGDEPVLLEYCRNVVRAKQLDSALKKYKTVPTGLRYKIYSDIVKDACRVAGVVRALAAALRLTQQSRYTPQGAATATKKVQRKPWEG